MKYIHITKSFKKHLKKLKKHLSEDDVIDDVEEFMQSGTKKGEALLKEENKFNVKYFKLRVSIKMVDFRYVLGVVSETDYIPVAIDLKKGKYGRNLSFNANKDIVRFVNNAIDNSMKDYMENSKENETATVYEVDL